MKLLFYMFKIFIFNKKIISIFLKKILKEKKNRLVQRKPIFRSEDKMNILGIGIWEKIAHWFPIQCFAPSFRTVLAPCTRSVFILFIYLLHFYMFFLKSFSCNKHFYLLKRTCKCECKLDKKIIIFKEFRTYFHIPFQKKLKLLK